VAVSLGEVDVMKTLIAAGVEKVAESILPYSGNTCAE